VIGAAAAVRARWLAGAAAAGFVVAATIAGTLMALLGAGLPCVGGGGSVAFAAGPADRAVRRDFSKQRIAILQAAGRRFDIDWTFLASIAFQECGSGGCVGAGPSGCAGPMAIAAVRESPCSPGPGPTLWERYGLDIDGDGVANVNDPVDAIFSAAHIMRVVMHAPAAGGSYAGYRQAACSYYGACADSIVDYANEVMARALEYGFGGRGAPLPGGGEEATVGSGSGPSCGGTETSGGGGALGREIVRIAQSQLGRSESPPGSNCTRYGPCEEWCSLFLAWVWERAGVPLRGGTGPYAYSGSIYEWAAAHEGRPRLGHEPPGPGEAPFSTPEANGAKVLPPGATPEPGDAVLYGSGPQASDHIGIVERVFGDGEITTIDGNYGDRVARVGPFLPSQAVSSGEPAPIFGYAHPGGLRSAQGVGASA
jgi:CHAP domain